MQGLGLEKEVLIAEPPGTGGSECANSEEVMYENKARSLCTAEAAPIQLFENIVTVAEAQKISPRSSQSQKTDDPDLCVDNELGFAKDRTISRLTEINIREYLEDFKARLRQPLQGVDNGIDVVLA